MSVKIECPSTGVPLSAFARQSMGRSAAEVEAMFGRAFFVGSSAPVDPNAPRVPQQTGPASILGGGGELVRLVFPIQRRASSTHAFVSVGRIDGNDIVIPRTSISKFHAYVKEADGAWLLQDARSRNGTKVGGVVVPARGSGPPVALHDGAIVSFGTSFMTFHVAASMVGLAKGVFPRT